MKIQITESDIENMVLEGVRRVLEARMLRENQDWREVIGNAMVQKLFPAFLDTFGHEYEQEAFDSSFMVNMLNQASPEKQQEFMARLNGTYQEPGEPIDLDWGDDTMLQEAVARFSAKEIMDDIYGQPVSKEYANDYECRGKSGRLYRFMLNMYGMSVQWAPTGFDWDNGGEFNVDAHDPGFNLLKAYVK